MGVLRVPKAAHKLRQSSSSQSLGSPPTPLALCDVDMVGAAPATAPAQQKASCLVKVEALESNLTELRNLYIEAEVRSD